MNYSNKPNLFIRFWKTDNSKISLVRDVLVAFLLVLIILTSLWAYTGQWFGAPMVAVESGSMEHFNPPFGRLGTIDAGDMVLLVKVDSKDDVVPRGSEFYGALAEENSAHLNYGDYGDVIVYRPLGDETTDQIIHRAICWVEYHEEYGTYTVEAYGIYNDSKIDIGVLGLSNYKPSNSGFITKGDNPLSNTQAEQASFNSPFCICKEPVKIEWISGKASGEIPWIGTINLFFNDLVNGELFGSQSTVGNVHRDSFDCLIVFIEFLILIPVSLDMLGHYKQRKKQLIYVNKKRMETYNPEQTMIKSDNAFNKTTDLLSLVVTYWFAMILLFTISYFLVIDFIADVFHFVIIVIVHLIFLAFLNIEGKILNVKDLKIWLLITAFTGPIGMTIFYFYKIGKT